MDQIFLAFSDHNRRTILDALRRRAATAGELAALLPIARPGVSRHLRMLREAGLVQVRRQAQFRVYELSPAPFAEVDQWLGHYRRLWEQRMQSLAAEVQRGNNKRRSAK